jgi:hypothetical protein
VIRALIQVDRCSSLTTTSRSWITNFKGRSGVIYYTVIRLTFIPIRLNSLDVNPHSLQSRELHSKKKKTFHFLPGFTFTVHQTSHNQTRSVISYHMSRKQETRQKSALDVFSRASQPHITHPWLPPRPHW